MAGKKSTSRAGSTSPRIILKSLACASRCCAAQKSGHGAVVVAPAPKKTAPDGAEHIGASLQGLVLLGPTSAEAGVRLMRQLPVPSHGPPAPLPEVSVPATWVAATLSVHAGVLRAVVWLDEQQRAEWETAKNYRDRDGGPRNDMAEEAARDHRGRAEALRKDYALGAMSAGDVLERLRGHRDHAQHWATWALNCYRWVPFGDVIYGYVWYVHEMAGRRYQACIDFIEKLDTDPRPSGTPGRSSLHLLFGTTGGSDAEFEEELLIKEGYESELTLGAELSWKVTESAKAGGEVLGRAVEASMGTEFSSLVRTANTYKTHRYIERKTKVRIAASKPCYYYQLKTDVDMVNASPVGLWGGYFMSDKPITA